MSIALAGERFGKYLSPIQKNPFEDTSSVLTKSPLRFRDPGLETGAVSVRDKQTLWERGSGIKHTSTALAKL